MVAIVAGVAEARARYDLGTGTQTDVSRLLAQRATAAATQASTQAALAAAAANYRAVVGVEAGQPSGGTPSS